VIVNTFSVLLFCESLFADGRNDIWSSRGPRGCVAGAVGGWWGGGDLDME